MKQQPKLEDHGFPKCCFETLPKVTGSVHHKKVGGEEFDVCEIQITYTNPENSELSIELPLDDEKCITLQGDDPKIWNLHNKVKGGMYKEFYIVRNGVLFSSIVDYGHKLEARVFPE